MDTENIYNEQTEIKKEKISDLHKKAEAEQIEVFVTENVAGKPILGVLHKEKEYYFNSRYEDDFLVKSWCNQYDMSNYRAIALVFGMGNGEYIRALRKKNEQMFILVFEPSYSIAVINQDTIGLDDILENGQTMILVGEEQYSAVYHVFNTLATYEAVDYIKLFVTPNYENIFPKELEKIEEIYKECLTRIIFSRNTILMIGKEMTCNIANNYIDYIRQYSLANLIKVFKALELDEIPAIIIAAGPSLDKNIKQLKKAKGKAFLIAVDTALNPLAKEDIIPDISITVDPHKPIMLFQNEKMINIPLVYALTSNSKIKDFHKGMRIYQNSIDSFLNQFIRRFGKESAFLETGGSVAHSAFSLAQRLGFKTIIFVGQDLAYPNDKEHSESVYNDSSRNNIHNLNKEYFEVEDIYGEKVKTEYNMNQYRLWFEQAVIVYSEIKFIDATEGGAKKKGMEILTLEAAIKQKCKLEKKIDFEEIIKSTQKIFTEEEQKIILKEITEFSETASHIRKKIYEGIEIYNKLERLNQRQEYSGKEFNKAIKKVTQLNKWVSENPDIAYLHMYAAEEDYQVRDVILEEKDSVYEEVKLVTDSGKKMLKALLDAIDKVETDMKPVIEEANRKIENNRTRQ
ncbi:MAG: motility associated factor glycosyltransferase family protein [Lachnospiraceae bacterium]|nr:motility associated factor glycosyltransferase family protein [Lachnospiraceae bacterium]